ncbi:germin-like protein 1-2 [Coffea arabica]|uniref:Germin-like protein n=1 Tax=Coffea arabica TaxID=13443 RepID=A0A6P6X375_COFAR|nr:germin-like protein 1-2 [Coffea arabica]
MNLNDYPCKNPSDATSDDFCYKGFMNDNKVFNIYGLSISQATANNFPGLNSLGISMIQAELLKGGVVRPHTHPRASELVVCTKGRILVGFVTTDSVFLYKILKPKMVFVIPQAMLHMVINVGKGNALLYAKLQQSKSRSLFNSTPSVPDAA